MPKRLKPVVVIDPTLHAGWEDRDLTGYAPNNVFHKDVKWDYQGKRDIYITNDVGEVWLVYGYRFAPDSRPELLEISHIDTTHRKRASQPYLGTSRVDLDGVDPTIRDRVAQEDRVYRRYTVNIKDLTDDGILYCPTVKLMFTIVDPIQHRIYHPLDPRHRAQRDDTRMKAGPESRAFSFVLVDNELNLTGHQFIRVGTEVVQLIAIQDEVRESGFYIYRTDVHGKVEVEHYTHEEIAKGLSPFMFFDDHYKAAAHNLDKEHELGLMESKRELELMRAQAAADKVAREEKEAKRKAKEAKKQRKHDRQLEKAQRKANKLKAKLEKRRLVRDERKAEEDWTRTTTGQAITAMMNEMKRQQELRDMEAKARDAQNRREQEERDAQTKRDREERELQTKREREEREYREKKDRETREYQERREREDREYNERRQREEEKRQIQRYDEAEARRTRKTNDTFDAVLKSVPLVLTLGVAAVQFFKSRR